MAQIVVGIDGSVESRQALAWALDEARRREGELVVLHAYEAPVRRYQPANADPFIPEPLARQLLAQERSWDAELHERARQHAQAFVERAVRDASPGGPRVPWRAVVLETDRPGPALVAAARHADLLVLGSRGLGAVAGRLRGSASQHCVRHARCPVLVVSRHAAGQRAATVAA